MAVNAEMVALYWRIGHLILVRQRGEGWGSQIIERLPADLRAVYPQHRGLSVTSLRYMRTFAAAWPEILPQPVGQIPWGHIRTLLDQLDDRQTREFYARRAAHEGWSRNVLTYQIKSRLHKPQLDAPTVGILLVAGRNDVVVEYALDTINSPLAVTHWSALPAEVRAQLPSAEELATTVSSALDAQ